MRVPALCDIEALDAAPRRVLETAAAMVAARARIEPVAEAPEPTVAAGLGSTVFRANGHGGAAPVRFLGDGRARALDDIAAHELGRIRIAGARASPWQRRGGPVPGGRPASRAPCPGARAAR